MAMNLNLLFRVYHVATKKNFVCRTQWLKNKCLPSCITVGPIRPTSLFYVAEYRHIIEKIFYLHTMFVNKIFLYWSYLFPRNVILVGWRNGVAQGTSMTESLCLSGMLLRTPQLIITHCEYWKDYLNFSGHYVHKLLSAKSYKNVAEHKYKCR